MLTTDCDIGVDTAILKGGEIVVRAVAGVGKEAPRETAGVVLDLIDKGRESAGIGRLRSHARGHDDLGLLIDGCPDVVALYPAIGSAEHDLALRVGEVALGFGLGDRVWIAGRLASPLLDGGLGFPELVEAALSGAQFRRQFIASGIAVLGVLGGIDCLGLIEDGFDLGGKLRLTLGHAAIAHGLMAAGVGLYLGAIEGHPAEFDQPGLLTQDQDLEEEPAECSEVAATKA